MTGEGPEDREAATRREPVGAPVVRGDPEITGDHASVAAQFDPDDPASLLQAVEVVRAFAEDVGTATDQLTMLQGAAACAALVRGTGSYAAAARHTDGDVSVEFLRKWSRVHDLPIAVRRHIARGDIAPTAAAHIARVTGRARFLLAWATMDHDLSVEEVASLAGAIKGGTDVESVFADRDLQVGGLWITLQPATYVELRRRASLRNQSPAALVEAVLEAYFRDVEL